MAPDPQHNSKTCLTFFISISFSISSTSISVSGRGMNTGVPFLKLNLENPILLVCIEWAYLNIQNICTGGPKVRNKILKKLLLK